MVVISGLLGTFSDSGVVVVLCAVWCDLRGGHEDEMEELDGTRDVVRGVILVFAFFFPYTFSAAFYWPFVLCATVMAV